MSENLRSLARSLARKLVQSDPRFAGIPEDEVNRLADYWAEDGFVTEDGVPCAITGTPLKDSLRYALEQKAGATVAPNAATSPEPEKRHAMGFTDSEIAATKDPFRRYELASEAEGKCLTVESWRNNVQPRPMQAGDEKLSPEEKIARANEHAFKQRGVIK